MTWKNNAVEAADAIIVLQIVRPSLSHRRRRRIATHTVPIPKMENIPKSNSVVGMYFVNLFKLLNTYFITLDIVCGEIANKCIEISLA